MKRLRKTFRIILRLALPVRNLSKKKRKRLLLASLVVIIIAVPLIAYSLLHLRGAEAAWFNENWGYRQAIPVTSTEGAAQNNVFVSFTLDTATLITAGKLQSNCQDIRITDVNGKLLKYHVGRATACNNAATSIDFLLSSFPDGQSTYYVYYGNPGAPSVDAGALTASQASAATITASGNEITDTVRAAQVQGDGNYPSATNLVTNGGFESNITGWAVQNGATLSQDTGKAKFGTASLKTITPGSVGNEGEASPNTGAGTAANGQTWTGSTWVFAPNGATMAFDIVERDSGGTSLGITRTNFTGTGVWQKVTVTRTLSNASASQVSLKIYTDTTAQAITFWADGVQIELSSSATDYIDTNGIIASRNPDSSYGVWSATTNLTINGGIETDITGWTNNLQGVVSRSTSQAKFGSASLAVTSSGAGNNRALTANGGNRVNGTPVSQVARTFSIWVLGSGTTIGKTFTLQVNESGGAAGDAVMGGTAVTTITLTASWQRVTVTGTPTQTDRTNLYTFTNVPSAGAGEVYYIDGFQIEQSSTVSPYVETNGSTTTRSNARVQSTASLLNPTQGWAAARVRMATPSANAPRQYIFDLATDSTNKISIRPWGSNWQIFNIIGNDTSEAATKTVSYNAGDYMTMVAYWTASTIAISVNGSSFTTHARIKGVQNPFTSFDIGTSSLGTAYWFNSDLFWTIAGKGTLTDTDAATINGWGNTDPSTSTLASLNGGLATPTFLWTGDTTADTQTTYTQYPARNYTIGALATIEVSPAPVVYFKFDENYGTTTKDSSPNGFVGTFGASTATPTWLTADNCISGPCLRFNGGNYVNLPVAATQNVMRGRSAVTISAWVRIKSYPAAASRTRIFNAFIATGATGYELGLFDGGNLEIGGRSTSGDSFQTTTTTAPALNEWHFVTGILDYANNLKILYIDGVLKKSVAASWNSSTYTAATDINQDSIGSNGASEYFNGDVDDLKVYNYARSGDQIQADFNSRGSKQASAATFGSALRNQPSALTNGLVGYWKMDEATWSGTLNEVLDSSGNGNNGTAGGAAGGKAYATGSAKFGNGGFFDGVDDYVDMGDPSSGSLDMGTNNWTVSSWIKTTTTGVGRTVVKDSGGNQSTWDTGVGGNGVGKYYARLISNTGVSFFANSSSNVNDGNWHMVTATYTRNGNMQTYVDGKADGNPTDISSVSSQTISNALSLNIGRRNNGQGSFAGQIDDVRIYNRALSPEDIQTLYNWAPGPSAYYDFEDATTSTLVDKSGNSNSASSITGTRIVQGKYGKGRNFNGTSDTITIPDSDGNNDFTTNHDFSVSTWVKIPTTQVNTDATANSIIEKWNSAGGYPYVFRVYNQTGGVNAGKIVVARYDGTGGSVGFTSTNAYNDNKWHYVTFTRNNSLLYYYIDGISVARPIVDTTTGTDDNASALYLGSRNGLYYFTGQMDELKIYNYGITAKQIVSDMNAGHPNVGSPVGSPVGYWKFDEGYGQIINNFGSLGSTLNGTLGTTSAALSDDAAWINDGKFGKALSMSGNNGADIPDNSNLDFAANEDFSFTLWAKKGPGAVSQFILAKGAAGNANPGYSLVMSSNVRPICELGHTSGLRITTSPTAPAVVDGNWHHIACIYNRSGNLNIYVDGKLYSTGDISSYASVDESNAQPLIFGASTTLFNPGSAFTGQLDEVKLYRYALTASEVKLDYNKGSSVKMGSFSDTSGLTGGSVASDSASAIYCVPGDTATCSAPVGEYNLDEGSGATVNDTSGNGNTGTATGTSIVTGKIGKARSFNSSSDFVSIPANTNYLNKAFSTITVEAWVYPRSIAGNDTIISNTDTDGWAMRINSSGYLNVDFRLSTSGGSGSYTSGQKLILNRWNHVALSYDGANITGYVNGINQGNVAGNGYIKNTGNASTCTFIGNEPGACTVQAGFAYSGKIDQVKVFDYARTPAQIAYDYNRGAPVGYWRLDDCQGSSVIDSSGNGNFGTISGSTAVGTCTDGTNTSKWSKGASGKFNSSLYFDGSSDYITIPHNTIYNSLPLTVSAWIKPTSAGGTNGYIITKYLNGSNNGYLFYRSTTNTICFDYFRSFSSKNYNNDVTDCSVLTAPINQWTHVIGALDSSGTIYIYVNGVLSRTKTWATGNPTTTTTTENITLAALRTGVGTYSALFGGQIDDVRIYNYPLTLSQIRMVYNQGAAVRYGPSQGTP